MTKFGKLKLAAAIALAVAPGAMASAPLQPRQAPGYFRMMVGEFEVTALSDGTARIAMETQLPGMTKAEAVAEFGRWHRPLPYEISINAFLINTGSKLILIDAGLGDLLRGRAGGRLLDSIVAAGYSPEQIDAVLISHFHVDHVRGLGDGSKMTFPNATIYLSSDERKYWLGNDPLQTVRPQLRDFVPPSKEALKPYLDAGRVKTFGNGATLFDGVEARVTPGHSPGHAIYNITSGQARMSFIGDLVHAREIQFDKPDVSFVYDSDYEAAARQRRQAFEALSKSGVTVAASHMDFPGIGHIRARGQSFEWLEGNYSVAKLN